MLDIRTIGPRKRYIATSSVMHNKKDASSQSHGVCAQHIVADFKDNLNLIESGQQNSITNRKYKLSQLTANEWGDLAITSLRVLPSMIERVLGSS